MSGEQRQIEEGKVCKGGVNKFPTTPPPPPPQGQGGKVASTESLIELLKSLDPALVVEELIKRAEKGLSTAEDIIIRQIAEETGLWQAITHSCYIRGKTAHAVVIDECARFGKGGETLIYIWPDNSWLAARDYEDVEQTSRGDDFMIVEVPSTVEDIDVWVHQNNFQDIK